MIVEIFNDIPEAVPPTVEMKQPNAEIEIFEGEFQLQKGDHSVLLKGRLWFSWFPTPDVRFSGTSKEHKTTQRIFSDLEKCVLKIDRKVVGECFITNTHISSSDPLITVSGELKHKCIIGDPTINVEKVRFMVLNLRDLWGDTIKHTSSTKVYSQRGRIKFEDSYGIVILDKLESFKELNLSIENQGGFVTLYSGEFAKKKGSITNSDLEDYFHCFATFLSFVNGKRTSPYFLQGIVDNSTIYNDYSAYQVDMVTKYIRSWLPKMTPLDELQTIWKNFSELWKNGHKDFLLSVIHWYVESNKTAGFAEGSIIMSQVGLEFLYNWLIIERKKILKGKDADNISASNKLRILLSNIGLNSEIPEDLKHMKAFAEKQTPKHDAPEAFVFIRNAIVHSQKEKRKKVDDLAMNIRVEALNLGIWYLEICLLSILGYKGKYTNRCSNKSFPLDREQVL